MTAKTGIMRLTYKHTNKNLRQITESCMQKSFTKKHLTKIEPATLIESRLIYQVMPVLIERHPLDDCG